MTLNNGQSSNRCLNCHSQGSTTNSLIPEGFYEDLYISHNCWASEEIRQWRSTKEQTDSRYRSYWDLLTAGFKLNCPRCSQETNRRPKFIGHSPNWEMCCTECAEIDHNSVSPYEYDLSPWHELWERFMRGELDLEEEWESLLRLEAQSNIPKRRCSCGGVYSMLAKPRCQGCNAVVFDSIFHICDGFYS